MLRTVTLSLLMLVSVIVMLPFASSTAHGIRQSSAAAHQQRRYRRHSRAWWRRHRARMRLRRAAAQAHRKAPLGPVFNKTSNGDASMALLAKLPTGWNSPTIANNGEVRFQAESKAVAPSQATLSVVARSRPNPAYVTQREQSRMLSGVSFSDLRRIVIEKMINAGGWVINDYERQVDGARVFVVIAQTPSDGRSPEKSWNFYFAEVDGNIYSLTLNTPTQYSGSLAGEGQKFLASLRTKSNSR
jgi:hypothetical protein